MVPWKIKNLTLEHGLLWNAKILKSEPPYCAFIHMNANVAKYAM
jgi:hypothetical protein